MMDALGRLGRHDALYGRGVCWSPIDARMEGWAMGQRLPISAVSAPLLTTAWHQPMGPK